jgi:DNA-binding GntR family transcriptional regulator
MDNAAKSAAGIKPVHKRSAEQLAVEQLRGLIAAGGIRPGARLTEIGLADQLQVARATVRVALHQLNAEGLVTLVPYTGWSVASLSPGDAWEIYTLRSSLEGLAARLATQRLDGAGRQLIGGAFAELVDACGRADHRLIAERDFDLHRTIVQLAGHGRLADQYRNLEQQVRMYIASSDALIADPQAIVAQHRPIADAILAGDDGEAGRLAADHNLSEGGILVAHLKTKATNGAMHAT